MDCYQIETRLPKLGGREFQGRAETHYVRKNSRFWFWCLALLTLWCVAPHPAGATPASGTFYWTTFGSDNAYGYGSFSWDGASLLASTTRLAALPGLSVDGSLAVGADGNIYSGRAGAVSQINPSSGVVRTFSSGVNNNITSIDPVRTKIFVGWKDSPLATLATGANFGPGTPHALTGSDTVATGLAWDGSGTVWYTTGGENVLGNVGVIDLLTFNTKRGLSAISATSITFDPFTGHIFTAGIDGIVQINPATGTVVSNWSNPQGIGNFIQNLSATGAGHLIAFDANGLLRIWDFSSGSGLIGAADTIVSSAPTSVLNGGLTLAAVPGPPVILSPLAATRRTGQPFVYQFETSGATSLGVTNLPPGLTFDASLSAIIGLPTTAGTFPVGLSATNAFGVTNATLTIDVQPFPAFGPTIQSSAAATGRVGQPFTFQVYTIGGTPAARVSASGLPSGLSIDAVSGRISGIVSVEGSSVVALTVTDGNFTLNSTVQLTFSADSALPVIISPGSAPLTVGEFFSYTIDAPSSVDPDSDPTLFTLLGDLPSGLSFKAATGTISGTYIPVLHHNAAGKGRGPDLAGGALLGSVQLFASNSHGTSTFQLLFLLAPSGAVNISTRLLLGTGENVLIGGFIVTGNAPKVVIIRALGPSIAVPGALQDPTLELHDSAGHVVVNDDWRSDQEQTIIGTTIPPSDDRESAIVVALDPGGYTAIVAGKKGAMGIGLVEVYDLGTGSLDASGGAKLAQISTRGLVGTSDNVMIGGFIISGERTRVIARGIGPSLTQFGITNALADPTLELYDDSGSLILSNDDWRSTQEDLIIATGVAPTDDHEPAIVANLVPGNYTGIVHGKDDTTGVALVEVYTLP